jgi:hypothetical protein
MQVLGSFTTRHFDRVGTHAETSACSAMILRKGGQVAGQDTVHEVFADCNAGGRAEIDSLLSKMTSSVLFR